MLFENKEFDNICSRVQNCNKCSRMCDSQRVLNRSAGALNADIMFVGEAPGRLGADASGIPFHGDKSGHNFENLIDFAGIERSRIFVTNAVLCNPKDIDGNNSTPTKIEIQNCASFLAQQIKAINPKIIVTLGATALESTKYIEFHNLSLKNNVRTSNDWSGRKLIPLYHPGQRAMLHRSFANQRSDYQFVAEQLKRSVSKRKQFTSIKNINQSVITIVEEILRKVDSIDYFMLHKIFYLVEYNYYKTYKTRLTNAYIVRQKDGPYCTDLHIQKLKNGLPNLKVAQSKGKLTLSNTFSLFDDLGVIRDQTIHDIIDEVVKKYSNLSSEEIKTKVYITDPMRKLLKLEKEDLLNLYNAPIHFDT